MKNMSREKILKVIVKLLMHFYHSESYKMDVVQKPFSPLKMTSENYLKFRIKTDFSSLRFFHFLFRYRYMDFL